MPEGVSGPREALPVALQFIEVVAWDLDGFGRVTFHSPERASIFGYPEPPPIWTYDALLQHVVPEDRDGFDEVIRSSAPEDGRSLVCRIRRADGEVRWVRVAALHHEQAESAHTTCVMQDISAHKLVERELVEAKTIAADLVTYAPSAVYELDIAGERFLSVNDVMCETLGYSRDELLALNPLVLLDEPGRQMFAARVAEAVRGECVAEDVEYTVVRKDGTPLRATLRTRFLSGGGDAPARVFVVAHDVTDRAQCEVALRESEARFRSVLENALDAAYRRDLRRDCYDYVSPVIASIIGYTPEEFSSFTLPEVLDHVHPDDVARVFDAIRQSEQTGRLAVEYRFRGKDGQWVWLADRAVVSKDGAGRPGRRTGVVRDITEHREAEESLRHTARALEESERQARDLIEYAPTGIYEIELGPPRFARVNDAMTEMTGYSREELLMMNPFDLLEPESARALRSRIEKMLGGGTTYDSVEYLLRRKDGSLIVIVLEVRLTRDASGRPKGAFIISHDVTERRAAEEERAHLLEERELELERTALLRDIAAIVAGSLDERKLSERVLQIAQERLGADAGAVYVGEEKGASVRAVARFGLAHELPELTGVELESDSMTSRAIATSRAVFSDGPDLPSATLERTHPEGRTDHRFVAIPIKVRGGAIGAIALSFPGSRPFTGDESALLNAVGNQVSVGFDNVRLYTTEHRIAQTLQETLVVLPMQVPGVRFSRAYESASYEVGVVGGDFVDVFEVRPDVVGITLGDVSGKGIQAAVTTSLIRTTLRVHALDGLAVVDIMEKANRVMKRFLETDSFVTLWFGMLDTLSGHLTYVCAGHPPGLVLGRGGGVRELECFDPFLGVFDDIVYRRCETVIGRGERLVLYSDGVIEARSPGGELFGETRLVEMVRRQHLRPTESMSAALMDAAVEFSQGTLRDDAAVLVVEPTAASGLVRLPTDAAPSAGPTAS